VDFDRRDSRSIKHCEIGLVVQASWPWPRRGERLCGAVVLEVTGLQGE
jgi:hypothetical protein